MRLDHGQANVGADQHGKRAHGKVGDPPPPHAPDCQHRERRRSERSCHHPEVDGKGDPPVDLAPVRLGGHVRHDAADNRPQGRQHRPIQGANRNHDQEAGGAAKHNRERALTHSTKRQDRLAPQDPAVRQDAPQWTEERRAQRLCKGQGSHAMHREAQVNLQRLQCRGQHDQICALQGSAKTELKEQRTARAPRVGGMRGRPEASRAAELEVAEGVIDLQLEVRTPVKRRRPADDLSLWK
mmetsp:Transcript_159350/g.511229  ORF Transcript_159350/g.511229 Transcript_159350/m.511229 type:complete len:240 (+) Transcript_159350:899-1618(+)